jgi:hypothetical protein
MYTCRCGRTFLEWSHEPPDTAQLSAEDLPPTQIEHKRKAFLFELKTEKTVSNNRRN